MRACRAWSPACAITHFAGTRDGHAQDAEPSHRRHPTLRQAPKAIIIISSSSGGGVLTPTRLPPLHNRYHSHRLHPTPPLVPSLLSTVLMIIPPHPEAKMTHHQPHPKAKMTHNLPHPEAKLTHHPPHPEAKMIIPSRVAKRQVHAMRAMRRVIRRAMVVQEPGPSSVARKV